MGVKIDITPAALTFPGRSSPLVPSLGWVDLETHAIFFLSSNHTFAILNARPRHKYWVINFILSTKNNWSSEPPPSPPYYETERIPVPVWAVVVALMLLQSWTALRRHSRRNLTTSDRVIKSNGLPIFKANTTNGTTNGDWSEKTKSRVQWTAARTLRTGVFT